MNNTKTRPQVKTRKWVLKKNGLYGWITSVREAKSSEKKLQNSIPSGRGVAKKKKIVNLKDFDQIDGQGGLLNTAGDMAKIR